MRAAAELFDLSGRVALVTGASSGIGWAIAQALAGAGADLVLAARRRTALEENAETLKAAGARAAVVVGDVADRATLARLAREAAAAFGPPQILVNAAGINPRQPAERLSPEDWDRTLAINLDAPFFLARLLVPAMRERGWGRIINIASAHGLVGSAEKSAYVAAKHGVVGLTRALALETAKTGVTVNAVCPGYTETPLLARSIDAIMAKTGRSRDEAEAALKAANPQGRFIQPEEVAATVLFLCGAGAASITGQAIAVSGGEI